MSREGKNVEVMVVEYERVHEYREHAEVLTEGGWRVTSAVSFGGWLVVTYEKGGR
jgi:hypothetical protein